MCARARYVWLSKIQLCMNCIACEFVREYPTQGDYKKGLLNYTTSLSYMEVRVEPGEGERDNGVLHKVLRHYYGNLNHNLILSKIFCVLKIMSFSFYKVVN